jgi:hypothetical protein
MSANPFTCRTSLAQEQWPEGYAPTQNHCLTAMLTNSRVGFRFKGCIRIAAQQPESRVLRGG